MVFLAWQLGAISLHAERIFEGLGPYRRRPSPPRAHRQVERHGGVVAATVPGAVDGIDRDPARHDRQNGGAAAILRFEFAGLPLPRQRRTGSSRRAARASAIGAGVVRVQLLHRREDRESLTP